jgi:hypothetical protein
MAEGTCREMGKSSENGKAERRGNVAVTPVGYALSSLDLNGNLIATSWWLAFRHFGGKTENVMMQALGDLVYHYRPRMSGGKNPKILGTRHVGRFVLYYKKYETMHDACHSTVQRSMGALELMNLARRRVERKVGKWGDDLGTIVYVEINPCAVKSITDGDPEIMKVAEDVAQYLRDKAKHVPDIEPPDVSRWDEGWKLCSNEIVDEFHHNGKNPLEGRTYLPTEQDGVGGADDVAAVEPEYRNVEVDGTSSEPREAAGTEDHDAMTSTCEDVDGEADEMGKNGHKRSWAKDNPRKAPIVLPGEYDPTKHLVEMPNGQMISEADYAKALERELARVRAQAGADGSDEPLPKESSPDLAASMLSDLSSMTGGDGDYRELMPPEEQGAEEQEIPDWGGLTHVDRVPKEYVRWNAGKGDNGTKVWVTEDHRRIILGKTQIGPIQPDIVECMAHLFTHSIGRPNEKSMESVQELILNIKERGLHTCEEICEAFDHYLSHKELWSYRGNDGQPIKFPLYWLELPEGLDAAAEDLARENKRKDREQAQKMSVNDIVRTAELSRFNDGQEKGWLANLANGKTILIAGSDAKKDSQKVARGKLRKQLMQPGFSLADW